LGRKKLDKVRDGEILRKPRSEERPFTPVSLHDVPLDDQEIENEKPSKKKKKSRRK
jgi:hypothetical protein